MLLLYIKVSNFDDSLFFFQLRDKDRDLVKQRFKAFNAELEDMVTKHQRYAIPDRELRDQMRRKVKELIQPHYSVFRKTFIKKEFTTKECLLLKLFIYCL